MYRRSAALLAAICVSLAGLTMFLTVTSSSAAQLFQTDVSPAQPAAPQAASIVLTQTVGTNPAVCATTQGITLPIGGGTAVFCYRVTNMGDISLTRHNLSDEQFGTILSNFPYTLVPGASAFLTQSMAINTSTVNSATWTAFNPGPVDVTSDSDTAQVNVTVAAPAIVVTKTVGLDPAVCATTESITLSAGGGNVTYCYRVRNTGNITLTRHTLLDDQLGTLLSTFPYTLVPGASAFLTQTTSISATTINSATWTAFNPGPTDTAQGTDVATVVIERWLYLPLIARD